MQPLTLPDEAVLVAVKVEHQQARRVAAPAGRAWLFGPIDRAVGLQDDRGRRPGGGEQISAGGPRDVVGREGRRGGEELYVLAVLRRVGRGPVT